MRKPRNSNPSSRWIIVVFSSDRRSPTEANTGMICSRIASAWRRLPQTMTTKSSA